MMKRSSFGYKMRQSLSDITNSQSQEEPNLQEIGLERLMKENVALVKFLQEKDKTIEASRYELRDLREGIHKLQVQNWSLAQSNAQFLAEINLSRNKVKALEHEVTCKNALLKAKSCKQEPRNVVTTENVLTIGEEESPRPSVMRSKSLGASAAHKTEAEKKKSEPKRRQLRRRSPAQQVTENLFEIEDLQLTMPDDIDMARKVRQSPLHRPLRSLSFNTIR